MRLMRRTSAASIPISAANMSMARSIAAVASGRPAPRYATVGVVFVTTDVVRHSMFGMSYTPEDIGRVMNGARIVPMSTHAPLS
ncbi:unannotated protein [freshwater metagenome]|uniref:Unannotated protein n=1 Tax=freshwater metagenome TaxID=449393 RepID=A0A6J7PBN0_9ZZZZ